MTEPSPEVTERRRIKHMRNEKVKRIIMAADRYGLGLKNAIRDDLLKQGYEVYDVNPEEPMLYQDAACAVAGGVRAGEYDRGMAFCGTGMGVSIICNKHKGVYAALVESVYQARRARQVNNANVLCMGGFLIGHEMGKEMANAWLQMEHMVDMDPEMAKIVGKEFDALVETEGRVFASN